MMLTAQRDLLERSAEGLDDPAANYRLLPRVEESVPGGILHIAIEYQASAILMGWRGQATLRGNLMGTTLDEVILHAGIPVMIARLNTTTNAFRRVVYLFAGGYLTPENIRHGATLAASISNELNAPFVALSHEKKLAHFSEHLRELLPSQEMEIQGAGDRFYESVSAILASTDLVILSATGENHGLRTLLGHQPEKLASVTSASILVVHWPA